MAALKSGQALVELDGAHLLEGVDDRVAVGAEGEPAAGVVQGPAGSDAVAEVALGGGAETGVRPRRAQVADVVVGQMGRVYGTGQRAEDPVVGEQLGRGGAVRRDAGVVLGRLLGQVHVQRPTRGGLHHRPQGVVGDGADRVDGGPDHDVVVAFQAGHALGPGVGGAVAEP